MLNASPMRDKRLRSPRRMSLVKRKSSELKGLKKLMRLGTEGRSWPALQGAGAGQAGKAFQRAMTALSWSLFLIPRPMALRESMGIREETDWVASKDNGRRATNVSAGTPEPNV